MKILIEIRCENKEELFSHLSEIRRQLKIELRHLKDDDEIEKDFELEDANCYGEHDIYGFIDDDVSLAIDVSQIKA